ncbi:MogA/MoaB family molybdenum cofactor biosynthesis protein [Litorihabitans aurantiacus]|uniref:Molybdenum cofactor biosynthesis protein n=1 Tax=Litorihabitans aurantiacus TaxID=1930061 RepID=A0AA37XHH7_9MICO|nr:MogA/MoaB family molybdenum cofactor biosynthesis protein [Litorihabitans aurantiacus]GMA33318.1 molybdenum cofactor biosynthesis protein [Litorihabitans aurantiacus]
MTSAPGVPLSQVRAVVVTVSDRSAAGERADASGPAARELLLAAGVANVDVVVVPDGEAPVGEALTTALAGGARLVLTLGGTGVGPRDRTPEATAAVLDLPMPGVADVVRARGLAATPMAALSRGVAGIGGLAHGPGGLVVNLPGSPKAVAESLEVLLPLVGHVIDQLGGGDH